MLKFFRNIFKKKSLKKKFLFKLQLDNGNFYEEYINIKDFDIRVSEILNQFNSRKKPNEVSFIYCLVGNIIEQRFDESVNKVVFGTKQFTPGTKVFCFPPLWGDGYERIKVIGRHRKSNRLITAIISSERIINWRLKKVYDPFIIKEMLLNRGWTNSEEDRENIISLAESLLKIK